MGHHKNDPCRADCQGLRGDTWWSCWPCNTHPAVIIILLQYHRVFSLPHMAHEFEPSRKKLGWEIILVIMHDAKRFNDMDK